jgi:hypothetical protein
MTEDKHALLSASGAARWSSCPASVAMEYGLPEEQNEYSEEGTRAHELASKVLEIDGLFPETVNYKVEELFNFEDEDMQIAVERYLGYLQNLAEPNHIFYKEQKVDFSNVVINGYGTADAIIFNYKNSTLHIIDFKYGFKRIYAKENHQLLLYAIGAINMVVNDIGGILPHTISLHIVQPRDNNYDTWTITYEELQHWSEYFKIATIKALTLDNDFNPSIASCKYCKAKKQCAALYKFVENITSELTVQMNDKTIFTESQDKKVNLSNEFVKKILDNSDLIKDYLRTIENIAIERLKNGQEIEGYKAVYSTSRRTINQDSANELAETYGDIVYQKSLLGIGALEKLLGKDVVNKFAHRSEGYPTLVKDTDKRLAISDSIQFENLN